MTEAPKVVNSTGAVSPIARATPRITAVAMPVRAVGSTTGLMQQGSTFGQFLSPPLIASVAAASGGWHHTGWVTGMLALGNLVLAGVIARMDQRDRLARRDRGAPAS
jgi:MFS family permease